MVGSDLGTVKRQFKLSDIENAEAVLTNGLQRCPSAFGRIGRQIGKQHIGVSEHLIEGHPQSAPNLSHAPAVPRGHHSRTCAGSVIHFSRLS
jgi:hypothetical protein